MKKNVRKDILFTKEILEACDGAIWDFNELL